MSAHAIPRISPEQYLAIERAAEIKSEYHDGQMFAMSGGSFAHSQIPVGIAVALRLGRLASNCKISNSDLRVRIAPEGPYVYPDLSICCGEPELADDYKDTLLNPTVVFEVLSKSSEGYDRGYKFAEYRRIPSLRDYVLVSQIEPRVEVFSKVQDAKWTMTEFVGIDAICQIPSVGCEIALAEVYRGISFETA